MCFFGSSECPSRRKHVPDKIQMPKMRKKLNTFFCQFRKMTEESSVPDVLDCQDTLLFYDLYYMNTYPLNIINGIVEFYSKIHVYLLVFFTLLDFFSNISFVIVLLQKELRNSGINVTMTMIAICNFSLVILNLIKELFQQINYLNKTYVEAVYGRIELYLSLYLSTMSDFLVVEMAFCRVMALFSLDSDKWRDRRHALVISTVLWVIVGITSAAIIPMTTVKMSSYQEVYLTTISDVYIENKCIIFRTTVFAFGIGFGLVPCILNSIFFLLILFKLKAYEAQRKKNFSRMKSFGIDHSSRMLKAVLIMFLLVKTPEMLLTLFNSLFMIDYYVFILPMVGEFMQVLIIFNASTSFIIYCTMSSQFREVFIRIFVPTVIRGRFHVVFFVRILHFLICLALQTNTVVVTAIASTRKVAWQ
ncbi:hypothetical protein CAEBREN_17817 [Caenorhabditis brenneri]|uniref:G-protein coupled receptors family 1 profile domain-containing protein n=1 Tax=Caenorhabditis brenneri TaxID=135651 RepID=G0MY16_CAEBE|nr:hypothetical protein CAEBREN_17817 [Caenorhabditis brenneri]